MRCQSATKTLEGLGAVDVGLDEGTGYVLPDDLDPVAEVEPWVALLPGLDPTVRGWKGRAWYLGEHASELFDRNGNAGPTVWANGCVVGGWAQTGEGEVLVEFLGRVDAVTQRMTDAERDRLQTWLGDMRMKPRFRAPLEKRLATR